MDELEELQQHQVQEEKRLQEPSFEASGELDKIKYDYNMHKLVEFVGMDNDTAKRRTDELNFLMNWGKEQSKSENLTDILYEIKKLRDSLGFQEVGETALKKLYAYIRLNQDQSKAFSDIKRIKKEKELLLS